MELKSKMVWDNRYKTEREVSNDVNDNKEENKVKSLNNLPKSGKEISSGYVPVTYQTLEDVYNMKILSERRSDSGGADFESKYVLCSKDLKLNKIDKVVYQKSIMVGKPNFLHCYAKKLDGSSASVILVKDRFGKRKTIHQKTCEINL